MAIRKGTTKAKGRSYASAVPVPCMTCYYPLNENGYCDACKKRRQGG